MQAEKYVVGRVTLNEIKTAVEKVEHSTVGNVYAWIAEKKGVSRMSPKDAYEYEYMSRKSIILAGVAGEIRVALKSPVPPNEMDQKLIVDLHLNHRLSAAQISQYITVSEETARQIIKREIKVVKALSEVLGIVRKEESEALAAQYLNKDGSVDALKFAIDLPLIVESEIGAEQERMKNGKGR
ncbi:MAG: hypothetical protein KGH53_01815 [Candidatus Micrarchaeota archaeon]|nr:hypothetical protein [Candidatus Micrarchaeota archaeon]